VDGLGLAQALPDQIEVSPWGIPLMPAKRTV